MANEHPFAQYIRILGKGRNGSRSLSQQEAHAAMNMVITGTVEPMQLGAFLMLLRVKEETAEEVAGFVQAVRESLNLPIDLLTEMRVDLDWSSYAGKKRQLPWYLLAAQLLAQNGVRILMHGAAGHTAGRLYSKDVLPQLGIPVASDLEQARAQINTTNFAYLDLQQLSPVLHEIIELRPLLGLRSPVHTIARLINPLNAPYSLCGIFHPGYRPIHQQAGLLLEDEHLAVIKGDGGEAERNPDLTCLIQSLHQGETTEEEWPAMFEKRHLRSDDLDINQLIETWQGNNENEYGVAAVIGTTAICMQLMGKTKNREQAETLARDMWNKRDKQELSN